VKSAALFFRPVDNIQLVAFRAVYGFFLLAEAWGAIITGWVQRVFVEPKFTFPFMAFDFLQPLEGNGMIAYYLVMGLFALLVMLGWYYRQAIIAYSLLWAGVYFMQKSSYNNHYYLMLLFNFLFCLVQANSSLSLDVKRKRLEPSDYCPQWNVWIFKAMILLVYFYSAVAKMYPAWVNAVPVKIWFTNKADYFLLGPLLQEEAFQYFVAWGGIAFDLLIGPALLWRKTRTYAFIASLFFHLFNSIVFQVGVFPYLGISFALFFFEPSLLRKRLKLPTIPELKTGVQWTSRRKGIAVLLSAFLLLQILLPLRHWYFPGDVNWTEEGHRLSWHMMLRVKRGTVQLKLVDHVSDRTEWIPLNEHLSPKQARLIATRPDLLWQFIQYLKDYYREKGRSNFSIYAEGAVSLNDAPVRALYDPGYDLVKAEWSAFKTSEWVLK
jgi:hypothetical protein